MTRFVHSRSLITSIVLAIPVTLALLMATAHAQSTQGLRSAADHYRDAARDFERYVDRSSYFNQYDERLADQHEDISGEFRSASRNPRDIDRLLYHWNDLKTIHFRIEETLVRRCAPHDPELGHLWHHVDEAYERVVVELSCIRNHHHHDSGLSFRPVPNHPVILPGEAYRRDAIESRLNAPPFVGSQGAQRNSRRDVGVAIATSLLNQLLD